MKIYNFAVVSVALFLLAGCWTVSETEYPEVSAISIAKLPAGKNLSVSLSGFDVKLQKYVVPEGHEAMPTNADDRVDGPCVRENNSTNVYYCTRNTTTRKLIDRASVGLERKGYSVVAVQPQYVIDVAFDGPHDREYDVLKQVGLMICTIFTAEKNMETWNAKLKVYDRADKKVVFEKDYTQTYEVAIWGPIPIASPGCSSKITCTAASSWALTALTDLAIADAAGFLADKAK